MRSRAEGVEEKGSRAKSVEKQAAASEQHANQFRMRQKGVTPAQKTERNGIANRSLGNRTVQMVDKRNEDKGYTFRSFSILTAKHLAWDSGFSKE